MREVRSKDVIETIGVIAIVASLVFVGWEIRQDRELTRAQLGAESFDNGVALRLAMSEPSVARSFDKMLERPTELSTDEMIQVNSLFETASHMIRRECYLASLGVFDECRAITIGTSRLLFGNEYAQSWLQANNGEFDTEFNLTPEWLNQAMLGQDAGANIAKIRQTQDGL